MLNIEYVHRACCVHASRSVPGIAAIAATLTAVTRAAPSALPRCPAAAASPSMPAAERCSAGALGSEARPPPATSCMRSGDGTHS